MTAFKSDFLNTLQERGFIHQCSDFDGLDALAAKGQATAYVGYDCTAPSLHIGNYLTMMMLHWLQQSGNKPITLMGGGTTMVGDPSGKDESRAIRSIEEIEANKASIRGVFAKVLRYGDGASDAIMLDNAEWLTKLNWIEMLRDIGRHFSVNRMLTMDSVRLRLEREQEMSFIEFNYMVCQAYDFVELARRTGCRLQMGGSDQWGNIVNGVDLGRRMGTRAIVRADDAAAHDRLGRQDGQDRARRGLAQRRRMQPLRFLAVLAQRRGRRRRQVPKAVHDPADERDQQAGGAAGRRDQRSQEGAGDGGDRAAARPRRRQHAPPKPRGRPLRKARSRKVCRRWKFRAANLRPALACWRCSSGPASSPRMARRAARSRAAGLRVNDAAVTDEKMVLNAGHLTPEGVIKLSMGKKKHVLLKPA